MEEFLKSKINIETGEINLNSNDLTKILYYDNVNRLFAEKLGIKFISQFEPVCRRDLLLRGKLSYWHFSFNAEPTLILVSRKFP